MRLGQWALQWFVRWAARSQGFLDPIALMGQLRRFGQPAEVLAPTELLRAGAVLHARGLMNSQAIQHNLDWVWPYWVARQFDPHDASFVPRAFSLTHINLTHRNWTAVGLPDIDELPIVDPRGLVTPHLDGWSLDGWMIADSGEVLIPAREPASVQRLAHDPGPAVVTESLHGAQALRQRAEVLRNASGQVSCHVQWVGVAETPGWLVVSLRPCNPEGVSFVRQIAARPARDGWVVNKRDQVVVSPNPDRLLFSRYRWGDVFQQLRGTPPHERDVVCDVGMATAAAAFRLEPHQPREVSVEVPLRTGSRPAHAAAATWSGAFEGGHCRLRVPDARWQSLYDAALSTLILHAPGEVYPGPYTYKRFWFRDAAMIIHALLCAGFTERAERALDRFPSRQTATGYFRSQHGEWDANGQALWILRRFGELTGVPPKHAWRIAALRGGHWIRRKRLPERPPSPHAGLLPAGFSAEHLGPNDYYYWDDFWGVAGLRAASQMLADSGDAHDAVVLHDEGESLMASIERSLALVAQRTGLSAVPAAPYRRMDAGAIGSLAGGYPLQLWPADDARLRETAEFLVSECLVDGGFFQNISHSGINPYLTLHIAQVLLRAGDARFLDLAETIARLASPTGQWPEAVHPKTLGGCMGDGQHVWATAEWVLLVRHLFVREESDERLILCAGLPPAWCTAGSGPIEFGPAPTKYGAISIAVQPDPDRVTVSWTAQWREQPVLEIRVPGTSPVTVPGAQSSVVLKRVAG